MVWNARTFACLSTKELKRRRSATDGKQPSFDGTRSSGKEQFSTANVSAGEEAGGSRAGYKGYDHEDGNGALIMHGPLSITLAWSSAVVSRHFYCRSCLPGAIWANRIAEQGCMSREMPWAGALRGLLLKIAVEHHERASSCFSRWTLEAFRVSSEARSVQTAQTSLANHNASRSHSAIS